MAIRLAVPNGSYFVEVAYRTGEYPSSNLRLHDQFDPFLWSLFQAQIPIGIYHVEDTVRAYRDHGDEDIVEHLYKPRQVDFNAREDWSRYGSRLTGFVLAASLVYRGSIKAFNPGREHLVGHPQLRGDLGPRLDFGVPFYTSDWADLGRPTTYGLFSSAGPFWIPKILGTNYTSNSLRGIPDVGGIEFMIHRTYTGAPLSPRWIFGDLLSSFYTQCGNPAGTTIYLGAGTPRAVNLYNFTYSNTWPVVISYDFVTHTGTSSVQNPSAIKWSYWFHSTWTVGFSESLQAANHAFNGVSPYIENIGSIGSLNFGHEIEVTGFWSYDGSPPASGYSIGSTQEVSYSPPAGPVYHSDAARGDGSSTITGFSNFVGRRYLRNFTVMVDWWMDDIRASSFFSASDALDSGISNINENLIEAFVELGALADLLPDILPALRSVRRLRGGELIRSIKDLVDFLTKLRLQQRFAWDPDIRLIQETLPRLKHVASRIRNLDETGVFTGYGQLSYSFPKGEFGREISSLETHTKVLASTDAKSTLTRVLGARALGLLPSPSSLWDLVPLSFAVDWLFDIGSRVRDMESIGLLSLMDIQSFTHSYLVTSPLEEDELSLDGLEASNLPGSITPHLRVYRREVSALVPPPRASRWGFRYANSSPNWMTAGSLVWQLAT